MNLTELTDNPWHNQLLMLITKHGCMDTDELASLLDVSTQTVRRDTCKLGEQGLITRHHGGAGQTSSVVNTAFEQHEVSQTEEKRTITETVADYIPSGSTIFITIGTTVEHIARVLLNHNHLRIIINSLRVAHILYHNPRPEMMVPGGTLRPHNSGIIGPSTASFVTDFRVDYLVTSVGAIESDDALMKFDIDEVSTVKAMMAHARDILLVADHTKYHASAAVEIGNMAQITAFFANELPPAALKLRLQDSQIEIILPQEDAQIFMTVDLASYLTTQPSPSFPATVNFL